MRRISLLSLIAALAVLVAAPAFAAAASVHWNRPVRIEPSKDGGVNAVSCATTRLCVAVDASGNVITTTRPTGGNGSWKAAFHVDSGGELTGISCPTPTFCAAVDDAGEVTTSTDPTGGAHHWSRPAVIDSTTSPMGGDVGLGGISCPSVDLCVAVDNAARGNVVVSTDPAGGAGTWHLERIGGTLDAVSCASSTLCAAVGSAHWVSLDPAGGASTWRRGSIPADAVLGAVACPGTGLCAAVGFGDTTPGLAAVTGAPRGISPWSTSDIEAVPPAVGSSTLDAVGCVSSSLCVALSSTDDAFVSSRPAAGAWSGGGAIRPGSYAYTSAMSCTSAFCVTVDSAGVETTGVPRG